MVHNRSGSDGLHMQAITDPSKSVYKCLRGNPTVFAQQPRNGQQRASFRQCQHCVSALFRRLAISPLRRAFHTTTKSSSLHRHALSSTRAPHPLLCLRPRVASAPFFAPARRIRPFLCLPPSPPPHTMQVALHPRSFFSRCVPCPSPFPPRAPAGVFTHLFFISRGIYRPPLATSPCVRRLTGCCSFLLC